MMYCLLIRKLQSGLSLEKLMSYAFDAIKQNDIDSLKLLLEYGLEVTGKDGLSLIVAAADNSQIIELLTEFGADVNYKRSIDKESSLTIASMKGKTEIVSILINHGAIVDSPSNLGSTALMRAAIKGHLKIVHLLLQHGANINYQNKNGTTALIRASYAGQLQIVKFLIEKGADINLKNHEGDTALTRAKKSNQKQMILYLESLMSKTSHTSSDIRFNKSSSKCSVPKFIEKLFRLLSISSKENKEY